MKALIALTVLVAAAPPAWADSDPASPMDVLGTNSCHPIIGTATSVHTDPTRFGTDIILDQIVPSPVAEQLMHDGALMAFIPSVNAKPFPALDSYVGQKIVIWPVGGIAGRNRIVQINGPLQLQLLSDALADPRKTWCFLPAFKKRYD